MIKPNSRPKLKNPADIEVNFTFATPKSITNNKTASDLTSAEKRALGMWIETVLEYHSDDFLRAVKSSRKFSVVGLSSYMSKYYSHLKSIVQYYIIAAMIDYELIISDRQENISLEKQCTFINVVIEELINRYFRESQWLHKISYLPIYSFFPLFDQYSKGYTTLKELRNIVKRLLSSTKSVMFQKQRKTSQKKQRLLSLKLNNNIQGRDGKIYQENIEQLMLRVNLVNFEQKQVSIAKRYQSIKQILDQYQQLMTERYENQCQQNIMQEIKQKEEIQIMKQNFQIKYRSNIMGKTNDQNQNKNQMNRGQDLYMDKIPESIFSTMPHYSSNLTIHKPQTIDFSLKTRNRQQVKNQCLNQQNRLRAQEQADQLLLIQRTAQEVKQNIILRQNQLHCEFVDNNIKEIEKNKKALQYRDSILQQLQFIRKQKKSNHFRLLNYI